MQQIIAVDFRNQNHNLYVDFIPDQCPLCHTGIDPRMKLAIFEDKHVQVVFQCTMKNCRSLFIASYQPTGSQSQYKFVGSAPKHPQKADFSREIREISPSFVDIYNQAIAAEAFNLEHLSGIGLRKSLEFLIKDYLLQQAADEEQKTAILTTALGKCITDKVEDTRIKQCAARAAWLGNDETHYVKVWADKDITDLKLLIKLTVNWIESAILTKRYVEDMHRNQ